uniref:glutaminase n=1 Tax=Hirondellea gigas TaxID=1518452 RepID=A0A2P2I911_9CRUS
MSQEPAWRDSMCISVDGDDKKEGKSNVEDVLFDMFKDDQTEKVHMGRFMAALTETGLQRSDPRLKEFRDNLSRVHASVTNHEESSVTALNLTRDQFKQVICDNVVLISRSLRHHFVIPQWGEFCSHIEDFFWASKALTGGKIASYIPQLARFSPEYWGVSVCSIDGQRYSIGDTNMSFTMQSCSKPITYAIALNELDADTVHRYVGTEPSGRMFNAIVLDYNNKPHNPLVNAGAIIVSALLHQLVKPDMTSSEKFDFVQQYFSRMAGGETVGFSNGTFLSERENADRNYALAYYMRENKCFPEKADLTAALDLYFQSCSMDVTTESVSVMAATLANGGICPITGDQVLQPAAVRDVLSLMHSCGMYDYSGQFAFKVGLPAKSAVCGAIMLVIPNVVGICTWSPPLDNLGNSVRGIKFCENMVSIFNFHRYDNLRFAANKKDPRKEKYETRGQKVVSLLFSASTGDVTAMRRYALSGVNMSECDYDGRTALHLAASEGHLDVVKFLLEKCKVHAAPMDRWKRTPADDASEFGYSSVAEHLTEYLLNHPGQTPTECKVSPPTIHEGAAEPDDHATGETKKRD